MKIEKFLIRIQKNLLYTPNISIITVKLFIQEFANCLSKKEKERWITHIQLINEFSLKQITIDDYIHNSLIDNLDNDLKELMKDDKIE